MSKQRLFQHNEKSHVCHEYAFNILKCWNRWQTVIFFFHLYLNTGCLSDVSNAVINRTKFPGGFHSISTLHSRTCGLSLVFQCCCSRGTTLSALWSALETTRLLISGPAPHLYHISFCLLLTNVIICIFFFCECANSVSKAICYSWFMLFLRRLLDPDQDSTHL